MLFLKKKEQSEKAKTARMKDNKMYRRYIYRSKAKSKGMENRREFVDRGSV